ncbi:MAG: hypothetical protein WCH01_18510 [Methylococcaceae bacterium]
MTAISASEENLMDIWERQGFGGQKEYDKFMYRKQMEAYRHMP